MFDSLLYQIEDFGIDKDDIKNQDYDSDYYNDDHSDWYYPDEKIDSQVEKSENEILEASRSINDDVCYYLKVPETVLYNIKVS